VNSIYRLILFGSQSVELLPTSVFLQATGPVLTALLLFIPQLILALAATLHRPAVLQKETSSGRTRRKEKRMAMAVQPPFKWRHFEAEIILLCVRWYLRYALS
jgi:hypothetical protein